MSTLQVDDVDSNLFTSGVWYTPRGDALLYKGGGSMSYESGARKVARFRGTSIAVIGRVMRRNGTASLPSSQEAVMQFCIDGGSLTYAPNPDPNYYDISHYFEYYNSGQLPYEEHVLAIMNVANDAYVVLDEFIIHANGGTAQILRSNGAQIPNKSAGPPITVAASSNASPISVSIQPSSGSSATRNQPLTSSITPRSGSSSSSKQPSLASSEPTGTASSLFSASIYNPTTINANDRINQSDSKISNKTTLIIVMAACLVLLIVLGITAFLIRRRRRMHSLPVDPYPPNPLAATMTQVFSPNKLSIGPPERTTPSSFVCRYDKQRTITSNDIEPPPYAV